MDRYKLTLFFRDGGNNWSETFFFAAADQGGAEYAGEELMQLRVRNLPVSCWVREHLLERAETNF